MIRLSLLVLAAAIVGARASLISVIQNSVPTLDPIPPQVEAGNLADRSFAFVDRTHELTGATHNGTSLLASQGLAVGTYQVLPFPSYLVGAQWVANANDNRAAGTGSAIGQNDYLVTYTVDTPGVAFLLLDNRLNGTGSNWSSSNTTDPDLGGNLSWVITDGWTRVMTGMNPSGSLAVGDYLGVDEVATVAGPGARTPSGAASGVGVNQFYSIYSRVISSPGTFTTGGIKQAAGGGNMYVVAFVSVPEPTTAALLILGGLGLRRLRSRA
jgi:hypothetical protein